MYTGCPPDPVEAGERWCSTKVDKKGNHITGKGFYGLCKSNCPIHKPTSFSGNKRSVTMNQELCLFTVFHSEFYAYL